MIAELILPQALREQIIREARAALPRECCGLIEGRCDGATAHAFALHPTRNLAGASDRFEIDPSEQFRLLRQLRGTNHSLIGCYHSHPNGIARPSARDLEQAGDEGFIWLIAGMTQTPELAGFVHAARTFRPIALA